MAAPHTILPDLDLLDQAGLKALILSQHEQLLSHQSEIEHLKLLIAKLRRMQFGRKSEKLDRQIEQLELRLEELQARPADNPSQAETKLASADPALASTPQTGTSRIARSSTTSNPEARTEGSDLSGLRRYVAQARRGCLRGSGVPACQLLRGSSCASQAELHGV